MVRLDQLVHQVLQEQWLRERRCLDHLDQLVLMVLLVCLDYLDPREKWEPEVILDQEDLQVKMVCRDHQDLKARKEDRETLASLVNRDRRVTRV